MSATGSQSLPRFIVLAATLAVAAASYAGVSDRKVSAADGPAGVDPRRLPTGACCYPDGSCQVRPPGQCDGIWIGEGTTCSPNMCQPCAVCGPGPGFIATCPEGDDSLPSAALVGVDLIEPLDCTADSSLIMSGPVKVHRDAPQGGVIDTEIVSMSLSGGGYTLTAGAGQGHVTLAPSVGQITQDPNDVNRATSFFDVFFELDLGDGTYLYNQSALHVATTIICITPFNEYIHVVDCVELWTSPVPGEGIHVANLVRPIHDAYPFGACCFPGGACETTTTAAVCRDAGGVFRGLGTICDPNDPCPQPMGACCDDCAEECSDDVSQAYCEHIGGRFYPNTLCSAILPPCGEGLGACCHDDGTCEQALCCDCEPTHAGCANVCVGDLNCDGMIDFGDINPFVQYVSNFVGWQAAYPACNAANGDINCDGTFGQSSFGDINPFVALITQCGSGCACPGPGCQGAPRDQGTYWAGPGTTCQPYPAGGCCTVVVPPGAPHLEGEADNCAPDVTNGGCNITPALFTPIENGWTVYGKSGTFSAGDPPVNYRDLDWYQTTTTTPVSFTVTVEAEFDVAVWAARAGPDPGDPCTGWRDVSAVVAPTAASHNLCTPVQLVTRCLPAGTYWLVVMPAEFSGVRCNSDYKITLEESGMCEVLNSCANCPSGSYVEGTNIGNPGYCDDEPADPDPNGGCDTEPLDPNAFEPLPIPDPPAPFTFCGKLWATGGFRDLDWYVLNLAEFSQVQWTAITEVPCRATILFQYLPGGAYGPPAADCSNYYYWADTLCAPCVPKTWSGTTYYQPGAYWFLVAPEEASGPVFYGYPCPLGAADLGNDYQVTLTVTAFTCASEILAAPYAYVEAPADPPCPASGYVDTYNSGCDQAPTGPVLPLPFSTPNGWLGRSGTWLTDPNEPTGLSKDYDWYQFTLTANRRFKVLLYADFPATWEIWKPDDCAYGPIEGLDVPPCFNSGVYTVRCYLPGTYWLRVYPTNVAACGQYYYLALTEAGACSLCNFSCTGTDLDDPCNDELDYDTNAGCDDPNGPPPHFMTFNCGATYCGRIYAGLVSGAPYYDPDWFQITQTNATDRRLRLTVTAEFLAHVEVYLSCADYDSGNPLPGLDAITPLTLGTACPAVTLTSVNSYPQGTVAYGRITCVDQFGNLLTKYYPCAKGNNRWKVVTACIV
jgi:hypothetical protein